MFDGGNQGVANYDGSMSKDRIRGKLLEIY